ncbi:hypothetical protein PM082_016611 [Marasmius tenuissimus]|nr:hypothetical protein PM082_016611 [Marasmius tenuissimus]
MRSAALGSWTMPCNKLFLPSFLRDFQVVLSTMSQILEAGLRGPTNDGLQSEDEGWYDERLLTRRLGANSFYPELSDLTSLSLIVFYTPSRAHTIGMTRRDWTFMKYAIIPDMAS